METMLIVAIATTGACLLACIIIIIIYKQWKWWIIKPQVSIPITLLGVGLTLLTFYLEWYWLITIMSTIQLINMLIGIRAFNRIFK